jgi:hypothetical protein
VGPHQRVARDHLPPLLLCNVEIIKQRNSEGKLRRKELHFLQIQMKKKLATEMRNVQNWV